MLSQRTDISDVKTALVKVLSEYLELKIHVLTERLEKFESKWGMPFEEFAERCGTQTLSRMLISYEVEQDFWEWERTVVLLQHYEA